MKKSKFSSDVFFKQFALHTRYRGSLSPSDAVESEANRDNNKKNNESSHDLLLRDPIQRFNFLEADSDSPNVATQP
jgi:hypothetical protein